MCICIYVCAHTLFIAHTLIASGDTHSPALAPRTYACAHAERHTLAHPCFKYMCICTHERETLALALAPYFFMCIYICRETRFRSPLLDVHMYMRMQSDTLSLALAPYVCVCTHVKGRTLARFCHTYIRMYKCREKTHLRSRLLHVHIVHTQRHTLARPCCIFFLCIYTH